jgi:hypothetical protein
MGRFLERSGSVILWSYDRGTLPYDVMCAAILLFVFLTPVGVFHDQPDTVPTPAGPFGRQDISYTQDEQGNWVFLISARLIPPSQDETRLTQTARTRIEKILNQPVVVTDIKPVVSAGGETVGHSVWLSTTGPSPN